MSHLSKITTKITNFKTLKKTLSELKINWQYLKDENFTTTPSITLWSNYEEVNYNAELKWSLSSYELTADSTTWQGKRMLDTITDKIQQRYAYNTIITEGKKKGFSNIENNVLKDGSLRLILEKWNI